MNILRSIHSETRVKRDEGDEEEYEDDEDDEDVMTKPMMKATKIMTTTTIGGPEVLNAGRNGGGDT